MRKPPENHVRGQGLEEPPQHAALAGTVIELCGSLRAEIDGRPVSSSLPGRQGRTLFAFLVVNRHRPVTRGELIDVLWPHEPPDAPEAGLSTVLARVRRALGDGVVGGRTELCLRLAPDADVDIERAAARAAEADRALTRGDASAATEAAQEALEIIERPLLPGIEGAWVDACRARLAGLEPGLLEVLARAALIAGDRGQLATAERVARSLAERHPFRESGYALLMEIQARRGDIAEATLTFDRLRGFLRDELGTVPSPGLSALHDELLLSGRMRPPASGAGTSGAPAPRAAAPVPLPVIGGVAAASAFIGREGYLESLRVPWLEAGTGQRRFALLVGEPGVGKTRLASHFAAEVHRAGGTVLYGRCDEEPLLAYQPFVEALRHYLRHGDWKPDEESARDLQQLSRLVPEARSDEDAPRESFPKSPDSDRYLMFEAVATLLGRATRTRPLLLVLDDLHWADKPTLLLLRHLLRLNEPARMMVLGLFRDVEVDPDHPLMELVADMHGERRFDRLALEGLDEHETDALIAERLAAPASSGFVRGLRAQTEGNPFFMEEALRSLVETRVVETGEAASEQALASMGVPRSVSDVILRRLGRVSDATRDVLTAASVIGREFDVSTAERLLDAPAERVIEALEQAMGAGLVSEAPDAVDRFMFCHALVRDAIYDRLSRSRRLRLHLRVGEALEASATPGAAGLGELAHHYFLARAVGGAAAAVRYSLRAGEEAAKSLAYEESAAHYRRALEALELDPDEVLRCDVLLALGRVQWQAGEAAALETYLEAADSARRRGDAQQLAGAALGLGERYWEARAVDEQYQELLAEALETLSTQDSKPRARLMARMAENQHFTAEQLYGTQLSLEALEMARRLGDVDTLVRALMGRHVTLLHVEHLDERLRLIDEVLALVEGHRPLTAEAHQWRLYDLWELGDVAQAHRDHARLTELARELRQPLLGHLALGWQSTFAHLAGEVAEAERLAGRSYEFADRAQVSSATSALAALLFTLRRQQGRIAELLPTMQSLEGSGSGSSAWEAALALAELETGDLRQGRERYERLAGRDFAAIPRDWYWSLTAALLAEICVALRDVDRAARLYTLLEPFAERFVQVIFTASWGSVQRYLGLLAGVMDRFDIAEHHFQAALDGNTRMGAVLMTAETQCAYGELLLRRGGDGDRERAAALGALADHVAAPRRLEGLRQRAQALVTGRGSSS
jgi:DNA-binding SARP family transcriptional activator